MIPLVTNMLFMGYAAKDILNFVAKKIKGMDKSINQARSTGYEDNDILKFISGKLSKGRSKEAQESLSSQEKYLKSIGIKTKGEKQETLRKGINTALTIGSAAAGAYGLYNKYAKRFPRNVWQPENM